MSLFAALIVALALHPLLSQDVCDPGLVQPADKPYGYQLRGERCEGLYAQPVRAPSLVVASWTEVFAAYDLTSRQPLVLEWDNAGGTGPVRLRAQALRRRLYYQMDAVRAAGTLSFAWPSDLLSALKIPRSDVGVIAVTRARIAGAERDLWVIKT